MSSDNKKKIIFFPNLDGLRFICFFLVFMVHSFVTEDANILGNFFYRFIKLFLFKGGALGVNMFFVLSGFLITYLLISEKNFTGRVNIKNFYVRRILRIWPLYFFCVFFGFVIFPIFKTMFGEIPNEPAQPFYYFLFVSNFDLMRTGGADSSMLNILWSVSIEEQFYLFWPLIVLFTPKRFLGLVIIGIILFSNLFRIYNYNVSEIEIHTFSAANDLGIGCLAAFLSFKKKDGIINFLKKSKIFYITAHLVFIIFFLLYHQVNLQSFDFIKRVLFSSSFALVIYLQCFSTVKIFALSKSKLMSKLGEYTYGLYCLHMIAILVVIKLANKFYPSYNIFFLFLVIFPLSFILSMSFAKISFKYFESYFLKLKDKFAFITKG